MVCEGYTDVIGLQQAGIEEAVATCGTALAEGHVRLLTNFARRIVLAYDADAAGQSAAERYYDWERRFDVDIRVAALPAGTDPADLAQQDAGALTTAVRRGPTLPGLPARSFVRPGRRLHSGKPGPGRRGRYGMVAEHPNELVRDQYLMQVADRCRVEPDRLRQLSMAPATRSARSTRADAVGRNGRGRNGPGQPEGADRPVPVAVGGPELEALRLAVHRPEAVADRLELVLFAHPLARACFEVLSEATTLHDAIEAADPQAADLLQRLVVEDTDADTDDVMVRFVERAGQRARGQRAGRNAPG